MNTSIIRPFERSNLDIHFRHIAYLVLGGLTIVDALNFFQILPYRVEFTALGRIISTGGVFLVLFIVDSIIHARLGRCLPGLVWCACTVIVAFDFLGDVLHFYARWPWYDQFAHFMSGPLLVGALMMGLFLLARAERWRVPDGVLYVLAMGIDAMIAVLYEVEEYLEDVFTLSHRLGDGPDTANDLMMNLIGGAGLIAVIIVYQKIKQYMLNHRRISVPAHIVPASR